MIRSILSFGSLALLIFPVASPAGDWPQFRGPGGRGEAPALDIPDQWTVADCKWRVKLPGVGHSSPVVRGNRLFVTSAMQEDGTRIIRCLDTADGHMIWKRDFAAAVFDLVNATAYDASSPALDDRHVYMAWATPEQYALVALDQTDGSVVWRRDLGPYQGDHGFGSSPIVVDDLLIASNDQSGTSSLLALDRRTGQTRWQVPRNTVKTAYSTPLVWQQEPGPPQLIVTSTSHAVSSFDPTSGKLLWELPGLFGEMRVVGSAVACSGLVFATAGSGGGGKHMVAVRPGDPNGLVEPEVVYRVDKAIPYVPTSVACDRLLFLIADSGIATCLDAPTGKVIWRERIGGRYFGSPIRAGDRIYCIARDGKMVVLAASDKFQVLGRINLEESSNSTPAVADGVIYLRTASHLLAVGK